MDTLKNKTFEVYDYLSRYAAVPSYFDTLTGRMVKGLGTNMITDTPYIDHKVETADTLDYLSLKYYGNPTFWWVIAYFNNLQDAFEPIVGKYTVLKIPNISSIKFGKEN